MALFVLIAASFGFLQTTSPPSSPPQPPAIVALTPPPPTRPVGQFAGRFTVPVQGVTAAQLSHNWQDAREGSTRRHEGLDIPAPRGTPVLAAMAGSVEKLFESARGGTTLYIRSTDGRVMCYYAHLQRYADGLLEGQAVEQGQVVGFVGDSGDAGAGNTHLHFAFNRMAPGDKWYQGSAFDPYPALRGR